MKTSQAKTLVGIIAACATISTLSGCNEKAPAPSTASKATGDSGLANEAKGMADRATDAVSGFTTDAIDAYKTNARKGLEVINTRIESIEQNAADLTGQAKADAQAAAQRIKDQRDQYLARLDEAKADTADAWTQIKSGLEKAWEDLKTSSRLASDEFGG